MAQADVLEIRATRNLMRQSFETLVPPPTRAWPGESGDNHLKLCFPGDWMNIHFHFFVAWFSDGSKSFGGGSEWPDNRQRATWKSG